MAEDFTAKIASAAAGASDVIVTIIWIVLALIVVGGGLWFIFYRMQFKHTVLVRDQANRKVQPILDKARIYQGKDGVTYWHLWKFKDKVPAPNYDFREIGEKGKFFAECVKTADKNYQWLQFSTSEKKSVDKDTGKETVKIDAKYEPLSSADRQVLVNNYERAIRERSTGFNNLLQMAAPILTVAIILLFAFLIFDGISTKLNEFGQIQQGLAGAQLETQKEVTKTMQFVRDVVQNRQTVDPEWLNNVTQRVPN